MSDLLQILAVVSAAFVGIFGWRFVSTVKQEKYNNKMISLKNEAIEVKDEIKKASLQDLVDKSNTKYGFPPENGDK